MLPTIQHALLFNSALFLALSHQIRRQMAKDWDPINTEFQNLASHWTRPPSLSANMSTAFETFCLPRLDDTFLVFPDNGINPYYSECLPQSKEWASQYYKIVFGPNLRAFLNNCNFELLAAYTHPYAEPDCLKAAMDFVCSSWLRISTN